MMAREMFRLALTMAVVGTVTSATTPNKPNVIFILFDDWGFGDVNINDQNSTLPHRVQTPTLARLARFGKFFTDFHTASPVCSPSRAGLMTARYPARYSIFTALNGNPASNKGIAQANFLPVMAPFVPRIFQQNGYMTAHFGKWHLGATSDAPVPNEYGFNVSETFNSNGPGGAAQLPPQSELAEGLWSSHIVNKSIEFMVNATRIGDPFYINLWTHVSHNKLNPTEEQKALFPAATYCSSAADNQTTCPDQIFRAAQSDTDTQIGRLVDAVEDMNLTSHTLFIVVAGDNGPEDPNVYINAVGTTGPFRGQKRSLYEGGHRIAMIARWPGVIPHAADLRGPPMLENSLVGAVDIAATMLSLVGLKIPDDLADGMDGEDKSAVFLRTVDEKSLPVPRTKPLYWEWRFAVAGPCWNAAPVLAMRDEEMKFLMHPDGSRKELYNLSTFLFEQDNLAMLPDSSMMVEKYAQLLVTFEASLPKGPISPTSGCATSYNTLFEINTQPSECSAQGCKPQFYHDAGHDDWKDEYQRAHIH
eukprot:m.185107 g.185107  ORF g.185107 m.185107 type:complete len:532 (+) comp32220_c0_seq1:110-1705(+)